MIKRGERGFAYAVFDGRIQPDCLLTRESIDNVVYSLSDQERKTAPQSTACLDPDLEDNWVELVEGATVVDWLSAATALVCIARLRDYSGAVLYVTMKVRGFAIIEKNADVLSYGERRTLLKAIDDGVLKTVDPAAERKVRSAGNRVP